MRRLERDDDEYPAQLRAVASAPEVLYVRGTLVSDDALAVAIVLVMVAYGVIRIRQARATPRNTAIEIGGEVAVGHG